jgi:hypothetical protein
MFDESESYSTMAFMKASRHQRKFAVDLVAISSEDQKLSSRQDRYQYLGGDLCHR